MKLIKLSPYAVIDRKAPACLPDGVIAIIQAASQEHANELIVERYSNRDVLNDLQAKPLADMPGDLQPPPEESSNLWHIYQPFGVYNAIHLQDTQAWTAWQAFEFVRSKYFWQESALEVEYIPEPRNSHERIEVALRYIQDHKEDATANDEHILETIRSILED